MVELEAGADGLDRGHRVGKCRADDAYAADRQLVEGMDGHVVDVDLYAEKPGEFTTGGVAHLILYRIGGQEYVQRGRQRYGKHQQNDGNSPEYFPCKLHCRCKISQNYCFPVLCDNLFNFFAENFAGLKTLPTFAVC